MFRLLVFLLICVTCTANAQVADSLKMDSTAVLRTKDSILAAKHLRDSLYKDSIRVITPDSSVLAFRDSINKNEFSISYDVNTLTDKSNTMAEAYNGAVKTVYVKGKKAKLKFASLMRQQSIYYYGNSTPNKVATFAKASGKSKYKFSLNKDRWKEFNKRYDSLQWKFIATDSMIILGKKCALATLDLGPSTQLAVYFLPGVKNEVLSKAEPMFKDLRGIPLRYEYRKDGNALIFNATEVNFLPIGNDYFKEPTKGYVVKRFVPGQSIEKMVLTEEPEGQDDDKEE